MCRTICGPTFVDSKIASELRAAESDETQQICAINGTVLRGACEHASSLNAEARAALIFLAEQRR